MSKKATFLHLLQTFGPMVLMSVPGAAPFVPVIVGAMAEVEAATKATTGAEKKTHVMNAVADAMVLVPDDALDKFDISAAISTGIDTVVSVINVIESGHGADIQKALPVNG